MLKCWEIKICIYILWNQLNSEKQQNIDTERFEDIGEFQNSC